LSRVSVLWRAMARHHSLLIPSICNTSIQIYSIPCMYATDTAQVMTPTHTGTACNQPVQVHMYYYNPIFVSFRHSRLCIVQVLLHATRYQSLLSALLRLASLFVFSSPHCLLSSLSSVVRRNLHETRTICLFWRALVMEDLV